MQLGQGLGARRDFPFPARVGAGSHGFAPCSRGHPSPRPSPHMGTPACTRGPGVQHRESSPHRSSRPRRAPAAHSALLQAWTAACHLPPQCPSCQTRQPVGGRGPDGEGDQEVPGEGLGQGEMAPPLRTAPPLPHSPSPSAGEPGGPWKFFLGCLEAASPQSQAVCTPGPTQPMGVGVGWS